VIAAETVNIYGRNSSQFFTFHLYSHDLLQTLIW